MKATDEKVIVSSQVDAAVRDELLRRARDSDRSLSAEVRRALTAYIRERIAALRNHVTNAERDAELFRLNCLDLDLYLEQRVLYRQLVAMGSHAYRDVPVPQRPRCLTQPHRHETALVVSEPSVTRERVVRSFSASVVERAQGRTIEALIVPFNVPTRVSDRGGPRYEEVWREGGLCQLFGRCTSSLGDPVRRTQRELAESSHGASSLPYKGLVEPVFTGAPLSPPTISFSLSTEESQRSLRRRRISS